MICCSHNYFLKMRNEKSVTEFHLYLKTVLGVLVHCKAAEELIYSCP